MMYVAAVMMLAASLGARLLQAQIKLTPQTYRSHFEPNVGADPSSGSRDGWESFPITQETGYEPTIQPETRNGISVLVREAAPTQSGDAQFGFIRRLNMVPGVSARLSFAMRAPWANGTTQVVVKLFHGAREEDLSATLQGSGWQTIHLHPAASQSAISALAIAADFPHSVQGRVERVELRDVEFSALSIAMLPLREPAALADATRRVFYMRDALHLGDTLRAAVATPAIWTLTAPDGMDRAHGQGVQVKHRFAAGDPTGIWTLRMQTPAAEATLRLLVLPAQSLPLLLFSVPPKVSPELLASVRKRRDELRALARVESGNNIAQLDSHWLLAGLPSYFDALLQPTELAMLDAIDYRASGDAHALAESQQLLKNIAAWPTWTHPWFAAHGYHSYYPVGIAAKYVVMAEQFLGGDLPEQTQAALDVSLFKNVIVPIYTEYVAEDRLQFNYSNWIGNTAGGALLAAVASRQPGASAYALGLFEKERDHVAAAYTSDGSYGEGVTYHRFDFEMTSLVAELAKRHFGMSLDHYFAHSERYLAYANYGKDGLLDYGDSHVDVAPSNVFAYTAALNLSPATTDFYFQHRERGTAELLSRVLWEAKIDAPAPAADEPQSMVFAQRGVAVLREGWSPDAAVVAMRAGKNFNHNHADQGSVFYAKYGKLWLGEAGYADYYKDPSYNTYNIQAAGHNVLLVDGNPESQVIAGNDVLGQFPSVGRAELDGAVQLVEADLTSVYPSDVRRYTRTLVFAPRGTLVVIDRIHSATPHRFAQRWHPAQPVSASTQEWFRMERDGHTVHVESFATVPATMQRSEAPLPLTTYDLVAKQPISHPLIIDFETKDATTGCIFVTVISDESEHAVIAREGQVVRLRYGRLDVSVPSATAPVEAKLFP